MLRKRVNTRGWKRATGLLLVGLPLCAVLFVVVHACVKTVGGRRALIFMSESKMHAMGVQAYADIRKKEKVSTNPRFNTLVTRIGRHIAQASGARFKWEFTVFDSKQVNAFCLPGGKIGVFTGILPVARTEAGLAAIMGHEVAHATLRHGAQRMSQNVLVQFGLSASGLLFKDSKYQKHIMGALGLGAQYGILMPYGRAHETEADQVGLEYAAKAGYSPHAAVKLWLRMDQLG
ncbi:MAG: M48 family metallopeptidase, partial [Myxococcota bacterium]